MKKLLLILGNVLIVNIAVFTQNSSNVKEVWRIVDYTIDFESIPKETFDKLPKCSAIFTVEKRIKKSKGKYSIDLGSRTIVLKDRFEEDSPEYTKYNYLYTIKDIICFEVKYYESSSILLINKKSGMIKELSGAFLFSPDCRFIFCASQIMDYEPFPNNIQIYNVDGESINLILEYDLVDWIPENIKWVNNNTICFEQEQKWGKRSYGRITISN